MELGWPSPFLDVQDIMILFLNCSCIVPLKEPGVSTIKRFSTSGLLKWRDCSTSCSQIFMFMSGKWLQLMKRLLLNQSYLPWPYRFGWKSGYLGLGGPGWPISILVNLHSLTFSHYRVKNLALELGTWHRHSHVLCIL